MTPPSSPPSSPPPIELTFATSPETRKSFPSLEAQQSYIEYERKTTGAAFKAYAEAGTLDERKKAGEALAKARLRAYTRWAELRDAAPAAPPTVA